MEALRDEGRLTRIYTVFNCRKKAQKTKTPEPIISFHLANAYRMQELYDDAAHEYENYLKISPDNVQAKNGLESCKVAAEWKKNQCHEGIHGRPEYPH